MTSLETECSSNKLEMLVVVIGLKWGLNKLVYNFL